MTSITLRNILLLQLFLASIGLHYYAQVEDKTEAIGISAEAENEAYIITAKPLAESGKPASWIKNRRVKRAKEY